jgi:hypothetical protein
MVQTFSLAVLAAAIFAVIQCPTTANINTVSVFRREEGDLRKYSAILAAIEPIRAQLHDEIKECVNPISYFFSKIKGKSISVIKDIISAIQFSSFYSNKLVNSISIVECSSYLIFQC